jgi:hypothetical protein
LPELIAVLRRSAGSGAFPPRSWLGGFTGSREVGKKISIVRAPRIHRKPGSREEDFDRPRSAVSPSAWSGALIADSFHLVVAAAIGGVEGAVSGFLSGQRGRRHRNRPAPSRLPVEIPLRSVATLIGFTGGREVGKKISIVRLGNGSGQLTRFGAHRELGARVQAIHHEASQLSP